MALTMRTSNAATARCPPAYQTTWTNPGIQPDAHWACGALRLPFDVLRAQHAEAVRAGLLTRSILESQEFEQRMHALEHFWLGPFARNV